MPRIDPFPLCLVAGPSIRRPGLMLPLMLGWLCLAGGLAAATSTWSSTLYPENWVPPESASFTTAKLTWTKVAIPEVSGTHDGVEFLVTPNGTLNNVVATVPSSAASGGRFFLRLSGAEN